MDAITPKPKVRFLPALAEAIAEWFPELGGRALAVSECQVTKENVPTLPLVMVAFVRSGMNNPGANSRREMFEIIDEFVIEFWLEPARYKKGNGSETPFWSYYDYETIRDTLLTNIVFWNPPGGEIIGYRNLTIEADALAVTLTFTFLAKFRWCPSQVPHGEPFKIGFNLCAPEACCPETCFEEDPCDPCT